MYSPGFLMVAAVVPPSEKSFESSYFPNLLTGAVPPFAGQPSAPALTPIPFSRLQKYLLIGIVAVADGVPRPSRFVDCPFAQSALLLPRLMAVAAFSTWMAMPVLK